MGSRRVAYHGAPHILEPGSEAAAWGAWLVVGPPRPYQRGMSRPLPRCTLNEVGRELVPYPGTLEQDVEDFSGDPRKSRRCWAAGEQSLLRTFLVPASPG